MPTYCSEELEQVRFPIKLGDYLGLAADLAYGIGGIMEILKSVLAPTLLASLAGGFRLRIEAEPQLTQRQTGFTHRQCGMQMQPQRGGRGLVPADDFQAVAMGPPEEMEVVAIPEQQHGFLPAHTLNAALPVQSEDVRNRDR